MKKITLIFCLLLVGFSNSILAEHEVLHISDYLPTALFGVSLLEPIDKYAEDVHCISAIDGKKYKPTNWVCAMGDSKPQYEIKGLIENNRFTEYKLNHNDEMLIDRIGGSNFFEINFDDIKNDKCSNEKNEFIKILSPLYNVDVNKFGRNIFLLNIPKLPVTYLDVSLISYTNESKANKDQVFFLTLLCLYKSGSKDSEFVMQLDTVKSAIDWIMGLERLPKVDEINVDLLKEDLSGL